MGISVFFYGIYSFLIWSSAALIVGGGWLAYHILKLLIKLLGRMFNNLEEKIDNKPKREVKYRYLAHRYWNN